MDTEWHKTLKAARAETGLSLRKVAKLSGLSNPYISQLENGKIENPSVVKMRCLLDVYGMNFDDLFDDTGEDFSEIEVVTMECEHGIPYTDCYEGCCVRHPGF